MPPVKKYNHNEELEVSNKRLKETAEIIADRLEDEKEKTQRLKKDNKSLKHNIKGIHNMNPIKYKDIKEFENVDTFQEGSLVLKSDLEDSIEALEKLYKYSNRVKETSNKMEETLRNKLFDRTLKIQGLQKESKLLKKKLKLQSNNNHRMFKSLKELWKLIETMRREK